MKSWWKAKKIFKFPGMTFYHTVDYIPFIYHKAFGSHFWNKFIDIQYMPLEFKLKFDEYRFEQEPFINVTLFQTFNFGIKFSNGKYNLDAYWEALLEYLYDKKPLKECVDDNTWKCHWGKWNERSENVYIQNMLTKKGKELYENG